MSWVGLEGGVIELKFKDIVLCWSWEVSEYCYLFFSSSITCMNALRGYSASSSGEKR